MYRYRTEEGREAFVNHPSLAPSNRPVEPVDLSHVSLNRELGSSWEAAVAEEHQRLVSSDHCDRLRAAVDAPFGRKLMRDQPAVVAALALAALLVVSAPWVMRRVGVPRWARFVATALPLLAMIAGLSYVLRTANAQRQALRERASVCAPGAIRAILARQEAFDRFVEELDVAVEHRGLGP
jgi:hypothetical protein